jgi:glutamyl-Q tRNA(Asp) synthetase
LKWSGEVRRQSEHFDDYAEALGRLGELNVLYPCFCTRAEIRAEIERAGAAPHMTAQGPDGPIYPGTCRSLDPMERQARIDKGEAHALRLDVVRAMRLAGQLLWEDRLRGEIEADPAMFGDVVLARKDVPTSYHLAVTVDDHLQGITLVVRGEDLFPATHIHRLLQALLGFDTPDYAHHHLLLDEQGKRFAKRDRAKTLAALREEGVTPEELREQLRRRDG